MNTTALPCIHVFMDFSNADGSSVSTLGLDSAQLMLHGLQCLHFMIWKTRSFRTSLCTLHLKIVGILLCAAIAGSCELPHPLTPFSILSFFHHPRIFPRVIYPYFLLFKNNQKHIQKASTFWQRSQVQQGIKQPQFPATSVTTHSTCPWQLTALLLSLPDGQSQSF